MDHEFTNKEGVFDLRYGDARSQAAGREVAPTKDNVVGGMLRRVAASAQPGQGASSADPLGDLSPRASLILATTITML
jgi:hypothetical protein